MLSLIKNYTNTKVVKFYNTTNIWYISYNEQSYIYSNNEFNTIHKLQKSYFDISKLNKNNIYYFVIRSNIFDKYAYESFTDTMTLLCVHQNDQLITDNIFMYIPLEKIMFLTQDQLNNSLKYINNVNIKEKKIIDNGYIEIDNHRNIIAIHLPNISQILYNLTNNEINKYKIYLELYKTKQIDLIYFMNNYAKNIIKVIDNMFMTISKELLIIYNKMYPDLMFMIPINYRIILENFHILVRKSKNIKLFEMYNFVKQLDCTILCDLLKSRHIIKNNNKNIELIDCVYTVMYHELIK